MSKDLVHDMFRFIKDDEGTSYKHLKEATDAAYANVGSENTAILKETDELVKNPFLTSRRLAQEGKLPADPSEVTPDQMHTLAEEKKAVDPATNKDIKSNGVGVTDEPEKGALQKKMDKETPNVDKLSDFTVAAGVSKAKKEEPKISGVSQDGDKELKKEKNEPKMKEGKLPADPSKATPDQIQPLAEERTLVTVSDENVAKDIASKYPGGRIVPDNEKKQFVVMVQEKFLTEEKTTDLLGKHAEGVVSQSASRDAKTNPSVKVSGKGEKTTEPAEVTPAKTDTAAYTSHEEDASTSGSNIATADPDNKDKEGIIKEEKVTGPDGSAETSNVSKSAARHTAVDKSTGTYSGADNKTSEPKGAAIKATSVEKGAMTKGVEADVNVKGVVSADPDNKDKKEVKEEGSIDIKPSGAQKNVTDSDSNNKKTDASQAKVKGGTQKTTEPSVSVGTTKKVAQTGEAKIKEDVEVTVTSDEKTATISMAADGNTTVSTSGTAASEAPLENPAFTEAPVSDEIEAPIGDEVESPAEAEIEEPEMEEEEAEEMAERILVCDYLATLGEAKQSEKQKKFIADMKAKKMGKKNKAKVDKKVKAKKGCCA